MLKLKLQSFGHLMQSQIIRCEYVSIHMYRYLVRFSSVVSDSVTPWTAARQASKSITKSQSLLKLIYIELVMPFNHLILCRPLLLYSIFPSIRIFSNAAAAAKSLQSCPTLCDPRDGSPPGSPVPGILQARILEWVAISFSNA